MRKLLVIILFTVSAVQVNAQICKVLVVKQYLYSNIKNHETDTATGILRIEGDTCIVTHDALKKDGFGAYISKNAVAVHSIIFENPGTIIDFLPWGAFENLEYLSIYGNDFDYMEKLPEGVYLLKKLNVLKLSQIYNFDLAGFTEKSVKLKGLKVGSKNSFLTFDSKNPIEPVNRFS